MATVDDLIQAAARKARIIGSGETFPSPNASDALEELNRMLGALSNENLMIFEQTEETLTLVASQSSYSIGENGSPDFNTVRPLLIQEGTFIRSGGIDYPLRIKSLKEYQMLGLKTTASLPAWLAYNPTYPNGTIYLYYTPDATDVLHLKSLKQLTAFAALTTTVSMPPGYEDMLVHGLAIRIGPDYKKAVRNDLVAFFEDAKSNLRKRNIIKMITPAQLGVEAISNNRREVDYINVGPF